MHLFLMLWFLFAGSAPVQPEDCSRFVRDVTIEDGTKLKPGEVRDKIWELRNCGNVPWTNRYLTRQERHDNPDAIRSEQQTKIPDTKPGESCLVKVRITAPNKLGPQQANWKITDANSRILFPEKDPIFVLIEVAK